MGGLSPASLLVDNNGNVVKVTQDGSEYKLEILGKLRDAGGTLINPSKEDGNLASVKTNTDKLDENLSTRASESTLDAVRTKTDNLDVALSTRAAESTLNSVGTVLTAIKDTDGIKKITDQLPAGTNEIGKVAQGSKGIGSNAWPQVLYDASGNVVGVVQDDTIYRLQADAKIAKKVTAGTLEHLRVLDDTGALKSTIYTPGGDAVNFPVAPADASGINNDFVRQGGAVPDTADLRVDGSATPVDFTFNSDPADDELINEISIVMVANSITSGSEKFAGLVALTNGLQAIYYDGTTEVSLGIINQNEDFMHFASPGGYDFWALSKDQLLASQYVNGIVTLEGGSTQKLIIRVADDLSSGIDYLKCQVKAVKRG